MESLWELTREALAAFENVQVDEETGEVLGLGNLDEVLPKFEDKAESTACYIMNLEAMAEAIREQEKVQSKRRQALENRAKRLRDYLSSCMTELGRDNLETPRVAIGFRKSTSVQIDHPELIPSDYMVEKVTAAPDKTAIKKAIQEGAVVPGASLLESQNLQIK